MGRLRTWIADPGFLGWGEEVVYQIRATGLAKEPADLYRPSVEQLGELRKSDGKTRFGKKTAEKLLEPLLS